MKKNNRLLRITTRPFSMHTLLRGQLAFMRRSGFDVLAVSSGGAEIESIVRAEGVPYKTVDMTRAITPLRDLRSLLNLIRIIREFKPYIVHTHTPKAGLLGMLAAWICRVPVRLDTVAGLPLVEAKGAKRILLVYAERLKYRLAHRTFPNSMGLREFLVNSLFFKKDRVKVIGHGSSNGIDVEYFKRTPVLEGAAERIRKDHDLTDDHILICYAGRIVRDKGIAELVQSFLGLNDQMSRLLLVGAFDNEGALLPKGILDVLSSDSRIILTGFQQDIRPWLMASQIFVLPSYREGFPNVVMQAACLELPCVVTNINGCNEIIQDGHSGKVIPVKDTDALIHALRYLKGDAVARKRFGKNARVHVVKNFEQQYVWGEILKEYNSFYNNS